MHIGFRLNLYIITTLEASLTKELKFLNYLIKKIPSFYSILPDCFF